MRNFRIYAENILAAVLSAALFVTAVPVMSPLARPVETGGDPCGEETVLDEDADDGAVDGMALWDDPAGAGPADGTGDCGGDRTISGNTAEDEEDTGAYLTSIISGSMDVTLWMRSYNVGDTFDPRDLCFAWDCNVSDGSTRVRQRMDKTKTLGAAVYKDITIEEPKLNKPGLEEFKVYYRMGEPDEESETLYAVVLGDGFETNPAGGSAYGVKLAPKTIMDDGKWRFWRLVGTDSAAYGVGDAIDTSTLTMVPIYSKIGDRNELCMGGKIDASELYVWPKEFTAEMYDSYKAEPSLAEVGFPFTVLYEHENREWAAAVNCLMFTKLDGTSRTVYNPANYMSFDGEMNPGGYGTVKDAASEDEAGIGAEAATDLSSCRVSVGKCYYTGSAVSPSVTVKVKRDGKWTALDAAGNYTVRFYGDREKHGTSYDYTDEGVTWGKGWAVIDGYGACTGRKAVQFTVRKGRASDFSVSLFSPEEHDFSAQSYDRTGARTVNEFIRLSKAAKKARQDVFQRSLTKVKPIIMVTSGGRTLTEGTDYKVYYGSYKGKKSYKNVCGQGCIYVRGIGKYSGVKKELFTIGTKMTALEGIISGVLSENPDLLDAKGYLKTGKADIARFTSLVLEAAGLGSADEMLPEDEGLYKDKPGEKDISGCTVYILDKWKWEKSGDLDTEIDKFLLSPDEVVVNYYRNKDICDGLIFGTNEGFGTMPRMLGRVGYGVVLKDGEGDVLREGVDYSLEGSDFASLSISGTGLYAGMQEVVIRRQDRGITWGNCRSHYDGQPSTVKFMTSAPRWWLVEAVTWRLYYLGHVYTGRDFMDYNKGTWNGDDACLDLDFPQRYHGQQGEKNFSGRSSYYN